MNGNILNKLFVVVALLAFTACKSHKQLVVNKKADTTSVKANAEAAAVANKIEQIKAHQITYTSFSGKAKTKLDVNGNSNDVTLNVRILRNQKIWISITAFAGIEAARALITPDSIQVLNKLDGTYLKKPFSYIYKYASPQVNYNTIESLLVGNAIPELLVDRGSIAPDNGNVVLSGNLGDLIYKMIVDPDLKVSQTNLSNPAELQALQVNNSSFIQADNRTVPSEINIASTVKNKNFKADLHYVKVDFDQPQDFPFSIPKRFPQVQ